MNSLTQKIEEFAKPAHKNLSVRIQNTTPQEIESIIDTIAKEAGWEDFKEKKEKNGYTIIIYQTIWWQWLWWQWQEIIFILILENNSIRLDVESRYWSRTNKPFILLFGRFVTFYDFLLNNKKNLQIIVTGLQAYYKDKLSIINESGITKAQKEIEEKISTTSILYLAFLKIWVLFWIILCMSAIIYGILSNAIPTYLSAFFNQ